MPLARIGPKHQITIPDEVFKRLQLKPGDLLEIEVRDSTLVAIPQAVIPRDQAWFWTKEWQEKEREADEDLAAGRISGPFTLEELRKHLGEPG